MSPHKKIKIAVVCLLISAVLFGSVSFVKAVGGNLDNSFQPGSGADSSVRTTAIQPDGKITIGGYFTTFTNTLRKRIAWLNPAPGALQGALSFSASGYSVGEGDGIAQITLTRTGNTDNKVVAKVTLSDVTTNPADYGFTPGSLDTTFNPGSGANNIVYTTTVQPDGKILIGGSFTSYNGVARNGIARLNPDGSLDSTFNPGAGTGGNAVDVRTMAIQPDGKIVIGGGFTQYDGTTRLGIARLNSDGSLDTTFNPGAVYYLWVYATALQPDGKIIIAGDFTTDFGAPFNRIARLNWDGSIDRTFNPGSSTSGTQGNGVVFATALQPDGKLVVGGLFDSYNGTPSNSIARLKLDGSVDTTFNPGSGANGTVASIVVQPDGKFLLGGSFTSIDSISRNRVTRLNADGSLDTTFNPGSGADSFVRTVTLQPDGKVIVGGHFNSINGVSRNSVARLNADGSLDTAFNPGANGTVWTAALRPDGKVICS
jgi:uncharacterized delta-60 repeat protein